MVEEMAVVGDDDVSMSGQDGYLLHVSRACAHE